MKTKNPNALNKIADSTMSHSKLATLAANLLCEGCSLSRLIKLTKTIVLSFIGLALVTASLSVGITAVAKKGETQPQSVNTLTLAKASSNSSVNKITLIKAGTGLDGEGGSGNTVLINNSAKWRVALNLSTGTTTVTMEFPNGNVIDSASVSSAAGCVDGSKVEKINGSYTNNKATCVIKADSPKSQNWDITDYVFGGNGQKLAPTKVTINGQNYTGTVPSVTLKGKANYKVEMWGGGVGSRNGRREVQFFYSLVAPLGNNGAIGLEPLKDGSITFSIDTSALPRGWTLETCWSDASSGEDKSSILNGGAHACTKDSDDQLVMSIKNAAIGYRHYPTIDGSGNAMQTMKYSSGRVFLSVPLDDVPDGGKTYSVRVGNISATTISGSKATVAAPNAVSLEIDKKASGLVSTLLYGTGFNYSWVHNQPIYPNESFTVAYDTYWNENPMSDRSTNIYTCGTWNPRDLQITAPLKYDAGSINQNRFFGNTIGVEYGVIGTDMNVLADAGAPCGKYGDGNNAFFKTLDEAKSYASSKGLSINAIRLYVAAMQSGARDNTFGSTRFRSADNLSHNPQLRVHAVADQWTSNSTMTHLYVPGLVRAAVATSNNTANSPANTPNGVQHVTITPYTYARDNNVKATVTLPKGLTPVSGSYKFGNVAITPNITNNSDGTKTLTFGSGSFGQSGKENLAAQKIEFDTNIDPTISAPQNLTINVVTTGDGTSKAVANWRQATTTFSVAQVTGDYGYNISQNSATLLPGDNQTYNFTSYNNPDKDNPRKSMATLSILPYNGDKNGTKNIKYSNVTVKLTDPKLNFDGLDGYYTTDPRVRNIDLNDHSAVNRFLSYKAAWHEVSLPDFNWGSDAITLPSNATAIKWVDTKAIKDRLVSFSLTINNVRATASDAKLATAINYVAVTGSSPIVNPVSQIADVAETKVDVSLDKALANLSREESGATGLLSTTNSITAATNSASGYSLTMKAKAANSLINSSTSKHTIEASASAAPKSLATNTWGYALPGNTGEGFGSLADYTKPTSATTFAKVPSSTDDAVIIKHTASRPDQTTGDVTKVAYGVNLGDNNVAGTYKTEVVYTVTANPFE